MGSIVCSSANAIQQQKPHQLQSTGLTYQSAQKFEMFKQKSISQNEDRLSVHSQQSPKQSSPSKQSELSDRKTKAIPSKTPIFEASQQDPELPIFDNVSKIRQNNRTPSQIKVLEKVMKREKQIKEQIFQKASHWDIEAALNDDLKKIDVPLQIDSNITNKAYEQRPDPYLIIRDRLPEPQQNLPSSWVYVGQWCNHLPHGIGKIYHKELVYQGYLHRGIPHLVGRYITIDCVYEGQINRNQRHGFGRLITQSGSYFEGQWINGQREGKGFEIHRDGISFEGLYERNKIRNGTLFMPKGDIKKLVGRIDNEEYLKLCKENWKQKYCGEFLENKFEGRGIYNWADKRKYEGEWKQGKMNGKGEFTWPNGKVYIGEYFNNKKQGFGLFEGNGKSYEGYWYSGRPHGKGKIIKGNIVEEKQWHKGRIINRQPQSDTVSMLSQCEQIFADESVANLSFL